MRPHQIWANVSSHTNGDSDVEVLEADEVILRRVFDAFVSQIGIENWLRRRDAIEAEYQAFSAASIGLVDVPIFWLEDTFGWYLYLCELTIARPHESPTYYSSRVLPFLGAIGRKLHYQASVRNLDAKLLETATERKREPDGLIFEILVALSYAELGFTVEFIPEGSARTPDMRVEMHGDSFLVECKRMSSRSQYAVEEERLWRKQWEVAEPVVKNVSQWVWLDVVIHVELSTLEPNWLARKLETLLPISGDFTEVDDDQGRAGSKLKRNTKAYKVL
ncbi:hypothetical protein [Caballeronia eucalypticola]|uniref:hypothetical protein n=1 Tax=Caballeronia sp. 15715 TaxID=3391030 RepID=UPI0039E263C0